MISIVILAQENMANGLISAIEHVLGHRPPALEVQAIDYHASPEALTRALSERIKKVDGGDGVLVLADVYGSSHTNAACALLKPGSIELVSGVNVPMLLRVISHRKLALPDLVRKALSGGTEGIVSAPSGGRGHAR